MDKREKIITKIQVLRTRCAVNPKYGKGICVEDCRTAVEWLDDAIALLKALDVTPEELERLKAQEQEPLAPIERSAPAQGANDVWYECRKCGKLLDVNPYSVQQCPKCGRKVKW